MHEISEEKHHLGWEWAVKDFKVGFNPRSSRNPDPDFVDQANFHSLTPNFLFFTQVQSNCCWWGSW